MIWSVVALAAAAVCGIGLAKEKEEGRHGERGRRKTMWARRAVKDANAPAVEDANRPARGKRGGRKFAGAFRARIKRLKSIKEIAAQEGATKTVAALDEFIGEEKQRLRKMKRRMHSRHERWAAHDRDSEKAEAKCEEKPKAEGKPKAECEGKPKGEGKPPAEAKPDTGAGG